MQDNLETIREHLHEIRNFFSPIEQKLTELEERIGEVRALIDRTDSTSIENSAAIEEIERQNLSLLERVMRIERELRVGPRPARKSPSPANNPSPLSEQF